MFARIASWRIKRAKSSLISFSDIVISLCIKGIVAGLEPATQPLTASSKPTELHDTPYIYSLIQAAGSHTNLRHVAQSPSALLDLQSGSYFNCSLCCCVTATIQPSILTTSLGLWFLWFTLLPSSLIALIGT